MSENTVHLTPELVEDPVRGYGNLRTQAELPHVVLPGLQTSVRLITRYADVKAALTEPRLIRNRSKVPGGAEGSDPQAELVEAAFEGFPPEYAKYVTDHLALFDGQLLVQRPQTALAVGRDELEFGHWPGDGFHLMRLPVRL